MLRCASNRENLPASSFNPVPCHRVDDTVRIGDSNTLTKIQEISEFAQMTIEPYGLSQLQDGGRVAILQLNLPLKAKLLDSLVFVGLPDLKTLHAWRAPIALESCSLAGLPWLEHLVINCSSTFDRFLTFGSAFKSIRLIGCLGRPLQFICSQCIQRPEFILLRILPGPPSTRDVVGFDRWSNSTQSTSSLSLQTCRPGVCSDDHLCRHNYPLKMARSYPVQAFSPMPSTIPLPSPSTSPPQFKSGHRFFTLFLPALLVLFAVSCGTCILMSLRISRALERKRYRHRGQDHALIDVHTPQTSNWTNSVPLNNLEAKV
ncbi:unnamed protein product [Hydatigera taeniaeformis]|uniref:Receptor L-domain domain-containing protein n=1 Tax=Hydatigena taeniaeformis TaxID=6205 RepID=A0A0R3X3C3_HYDTA|nr:unnamed protein product [Hydatigera taeniaeformis]